MRLANSVALMLVGITNLTNNPKGGTIMKTDNGDPTLQLTMFPCDLVNLKRCCVRMSSTYNGTTLWVNSLIYNDGNIQEIEATPKVLIC
ncbi:hypothetical protein Lalb_Chr12g0206781 [Lupinus albus]|uniref:Uncharacterized protein n=1 Tax=Lupinus albus TaxID=3870 RepID=A0A6A4PNG9_LUPAL|nr:hypothetical protein Lalb_Chr12g0206781 [Lupinus albus]